jgi:hypothetical protein
MRNKKRINRELPRLVEVNGQKKYGVLISEIGVIRMLSHGKNGFISISANRSKIASNNPNCDLTGQYKKFLDDTDVQDDAETREMWLNDRNRRADASLKSFIKDDTPYSYTATYGGYHGGDGVVDSYEPSYVIYNYDRQGNPMDWEKLKALALYLCREYNQDSVYVQAPDEALVWLDCNGNRTDKGSSKNFKINRDKEEYYTTNKRKKNHPQRFTADIQFENTMLPIGPGSITELRKRLSSGEYLVEDYPGKPI